nr:HPr family phosphocarrier protein [Neobacillus sp. Marseille-Q6967]
MIQKTLDVNSKAGLYPRLVTQLVQSASQFQSEIFLSHNGRKVNLKSIMGILSLAIPNQAQITIEASGDDEREALDRVVETVKSFS